MSDKKIPENVNSDRREFLEKVTKGAFVIPTVISVMMLNQKLNLTTANALSNLPMPECLPYWTLISTPGGDVRIVDLKPGMEVYTLDVSGTKVAKELEFVSKVSVPETHIIYRILMANDRQVYGSGAHPTVDGTEFKNLKAGDIVDGGKIISVEELKYTTGYTYDILPSGDTGYYWANSVLIGSTLAADAKSRIRKAA